MGVLKKKKGIQTRWSLWLILLSIVEAELIWVEAVSQTDRKNTSSLSLLQIKTGTDGKGVCRLALCPSLNF